MENIFNSLTQEQQEIYNFELEADIEAGISAEDSVIAYDYKKEYLIKHLGINDRHAENLMEVYNDIGTVHSANIVKANTNKI